MSKNRIIKEYFSENKQALNLEVKNNHPELATFLTHCDQDEASMLAEVAAYCNIELDGMYSPRDLDILYGLLVVRLKKKNTIIIH